jgi:pimeloyl-ACP methyl ester carboxylesterase
MEALSPAVITLAALTLTPLALWAHIAFWGWYYRRGELDGERHWVTAADGWRVALERHPLPDGVTRAGVALCCPGLACNGRIFHLHDEVSFTQGLRAQGYEVWIIHPRGMGASERPVEGEWRFGHADYLKDGLAALRYVNRFTREAPLWVGHSMGGLIGYELAAIAPRKMRGLITLGTPTDLSVHTVPRFHYMMFKWFCKGLKVAYLGKLSTLVAPWAGRVPALHPAPLYVNTQLLPAHHLRAFLAQAFEDTPRQLLDEFVGAVDGRGPLSEEGWGRYREMLRALEVPIFAVVSDADGLAPIGVTSAIEGWGPPGKVTMWRLKEYGHAELAVSLTARALIAPRVAEWAEAHTERRVKRASQERARDTARVTAEVSA